MSALIKDSLLCDVTPDRLSLPEAAFYTGLSVNVLSLLLGGGQIRFERMAGVRGVPLQIDRASIDMLLERSKAGESICYRVAKRRCNTKGENHGKSGARQD